MADANQENKILGNMFLSKVDKEQYYINFFYTLLIYNFSSFDVSV